MMNHQSIWKNCYIFCFQCGLVILSSVLINKSINRKKREGSMMIIYNSFKNARILGMFENKIIKNGYMRRHAVESSWWWWIFVSNGHYDHGHRRRTISLQIISTLYIKNTHTHRVCFFSIFLIPSSFPIQILNTNTHHAHFVLFCVLLWWLSSLYLDDDDDDHIRSLSFFFESFKFCFLS